MSVPKESSITPSTSQQRLYQDALQTLEESRYKQSQASLLILSLNQRIVTWGVVTIISSIIFASTFIPIAKNLVSSNNDYRQDVSQNLVTITILSGVISVFGGIQTVNIILFKKSLKESLKSSKEYYERLINLIYDDSNEYP
ncbi:MAG: hypothetical protein QNJ37_18010 [Crocosphaera sp.]|nr:hypothetical protein [Crocosphaera sp.]